jgi:BON domain-containing protein
VKTLALLAAAMLALAGCHRTPADKPAKTADAGKPPKAASAEPVPPKVEPFKSAVTGKPAPGTPQAADAELSGKVKNLLVHAPEINTAGLEVASTDGVVTLYGTVEAPVEKDRAAMLAMEVEGVRSVVNNLVVVKGS